MENAPFDAYAPRQIAERLEAACVAKAATPLLSLVMLGVLAGAFIGLGALYAVIVLSDPGLGLAASRVLAGAVFSLGLLLVVVAGAELFTGNNLLAARRRQHARRAAELGDRVQRNFVGAAGLALMVYLSGHADRYAALPGNRRGQVGAAVLAGLLSRRAVQRAGVRDGARRPA